ncbi:MAG: mraZ [Verrucomicrobia bacterium]|jgi:MraZ protein|nr:mraZ [Verrucomicrobiota bacterium]
MATDGKVYYSGEFHHTLDDKGRLTIPSAWRDGHPEGATFLATPHPDGYIAILPPAQVEALHAKIAAQKLSDARAQAFAARFFSQTQSFSFDKAGRVSLSTALLKHAGIEREAVLAGGLAKFSIYNPARWAQEMAKSEGEAFGALMRELDL